MDPQQIIEIILNFIQIILTVFGAASVIVAGLKELAKLTPTEKDDLALGKAEKVINKVLLFLDKLALNPPQEKARVSNGSQ